MQFRKFHILIALSALGATSAASAQSDEAVAVPGSELVAEMFECRTIENPEERLACFDREVGRVFAAQESKELVITDREQIRQTRKGLFGFTLPKIGLFGGGDDDDDDQVEEISEITTTLASARQMSNGRYLLTLEDGARWQQVDKVPVFGGPGAGDEVTIKKGVLGSYTAKIGKRRGFKVKRLD